MTTYDPDGPIPLPAAPSRVRWGGHGAPGLANPDRKLRGPNGRPLCRVCAAEVPPRRSTFCSGGKVGLRWDPKVGLRTARGLLEIATGLLALEELRRQAAPAATSSRDPSRDDPRINVRGPFRTGTIRPIVKPS